MSNLFNKRVRDVLDNIALFKGETIKAGEHPFHRAIVKLEGMCRPLPFMSGGQNKLFQPACNLWFACLWASRPCMKRVQPEEFEGGHLFLSGSPRGVDPNPKLSMYWAGKLRAELTKWIDDTEYLEWLRNNQWPDRQAHIRLERACVREIEKYWTKKKAWPR